MVFDFNSNGILLLKWCFLTIIFIQMNKGDIIKYLNLTTSRVETCNVRRRVNELG
jgi:hypothetical protein